MCDRIAGPTSHPTTRDATVSIPYLSASPTRQYCISYTLTFHHRNSSSTTPHLEEKAQTSCIELPLRSNYTCCCLNLERNSQTDQEGRQKDATSRDSPLPQSPSRLLTAFRSNSSSFQLFHRKTSLPRQTLPSETVAFCMTPNNLKSPTDRTSEDFIFFAAVLSW